jgi:hypothetical protein
MVEKFCGPCFFNILKPSGYSLTLPTAVTFGNLNVATQRVYVFRNTPTAKRANLRIWIPVAARSMAWICGRSHAENAGSKPTRDIGVCLLRILCVFRYRSLRRASHSSGGDLPSEVRLSVISKPKNWKSLGPLRLLSHERTNPFTALTAWSL